VEKLKAYQDLKTLVTKAQSVCPIDNPKKYTRRWNLAEKLFNEIKGGLVLGRWITSHYSFSGFCEEFMCNE